jgi:hypothetical protein
VFPATVGLPYFRRDNQSEFPNDVYRVVLETRNAERTETPNTSVCLRLDARQGVARASYIGIRLESNGRRRSVLDDQGTRYKPWVASVVLICCRQIGDRMPMYRIVTISAMFKMFADGIRSPLSAGVTGSMI